MAEAKLNLFFSCLYAMQGTLQYLNRQEQKEAKQLIRETVADAMPVPLELAKSGKQRLLLKLADKNMEATARLLNFLIDIHILT